MPGPHAPAVAVSTKYLPRYAYRWRRRDTSRPPRTGAGAGRGGDGDRVARAAHPPTKPDRIEMDVVVSISTAYPELRLCGKRQRGAGRQRGGAVREASADGAGAHAAHAVARAARHDRGNARSSSWSGRGRALCASPIFVASSHVTGSLAVQFDVTLVTVTVHRGRTSRWAADAGRAHSAPNKSAASSGSLQRGPMLLAACRQRSARAALARCQTPPPRRRPRPAGGTLQRSPMHRPAPSRERTQRRVGTAR